MTDSLQREIRTLRELYWSDRDPDGRVFATLADAYRRSGEIRQAMELLKEGLNRLPGFPSGHVVAARLYCDAGMMEEATFAARRALELDDENVEALRSLARALEARGDDIEARRVRGRLAELEFPGDEGEAEAAGTAAAATAGGEEVMSLADLAPDGPPVSLDELAPDEAVSLDDLAPDEPVEGEAVVDLGELAPDDAVSLDDLAPDEPLEGEAAVDLGEPAPEEPMSLDALAPDETEPTSREGEASDDTPGGGDPERVLSLDELGPDGLAAEEQVASLDDLAPGTSRGEEEVALEALTPDEPFAPLDGDEGDSTPESAFLSTGDEEAGSAGAGRQEGTDADGDEAPEGPLPTRTLADLYARQGLTDRALSVYRQLLKVTPDDEGLRRRIADLSGEGGDAPVADGLGEEEEAAEPEAGTAEAHEVVPSAAVTSEPAREPSSGDARAEEAEDASLSESGWASGALPEEPEMDTPFAWTEAVDEEEEGAADPGPPVAEYFRRMLAWGEEWDRERESDEGEA